jgi:hypothetical protein
MTYVPNTIEIPTYEADLKHHRVGFDGRCKNLQCSHRELERERRKKEIEEEERKKRGGIFRELSHVEQTGAT